MNSFWFLMGPAAKAAMFMAPVHGLFGLHIVRRGLIFIDLAVAQVAALGMSLAIAKGFDAQSPQAYQYSIGFALAGALLISLTRFRLGRVPHEAIIGIVYVLSTAASIVILEFSPSGHGLEELKGILAGNLLFVTPAQTNSTMISYSIIMALVIVLWRPISSVTFHKGKQSAFKTVAVDFAFYALLGFVVASSVKIAGVLVVFSWLVMPAVVAFFFVKKMLPAVLIALPVGILGSVGGLMISYFAPPLSFAHAHESPNGVEAAGLGGWPTGPSIVIAIGAVAILSYLIKLFIPDKPNEESKIIEPIEAE